MIWNTDQEKVRSNGHVNGHVAQQLVYPDPAHSSTIEPVRTVDYPKLVELGRELLIAIGEDPDREGVADTPKRWANAWREFIEYDPGNTETTFNSVTADQMVCISGMRVWSMCEHHMMPFYCDVSIGYIAGDRILGLSKFARIAHKFAHQLQVQERLGQQIADEVSRVTGSQDVAVVLKGEHLCMTMRGIRTPGTMTTSIMRGAFRSEHETRMEFLRLIGQ
ncbi:MAG: GTP cyclohydrolase I [Ktedonobacteraceae bacterium]|nr:GTP cyclohydrolase I [Ktedonobacteraceae bacterium]